MTIFLGVLVILASCWSLLISFICMANHLYVIAAIFAGFFLCLLLLLQRAEAE